MPNDESKSAPYLPIHFELAELWQRLLGREVRHIDESFMELGGNESAGAMLDEVAALTQKRVEVEEFLSEPTIRHLTRKLLAQGSADSVFDCVQSGNGSTPFYFFHGDILGGGFYAARLASLLGPERPMFVSSPFPLPLHQLPTVEIIATRKRRALQRLQPHGPYALGGFCVGAVVAYEVARQLEAEGEEVERVVLVEPEIGNAITRSHQRVVNQVVRRRNTPREKVETFTRGVRKIERLVGIWNAPWPEKKRFLIGNTRKLVAKPAADPALQPAAEDSSAASDMDPHGGWLLSAYQWVVNSYVPRSLRGPVTLLVTEEHLKQAPFIVRQWQNASPQTQVELVPGEHLTCITTHLDAVAEKIGRELSAVKSLVAMMLPSLTSHAWMFER
jgi:oxalate---CoA ligase